MVFSQIKDRPCLSGHDFSSPLFSNNVKIFVQYWKYLKPIERMRNNIIQSKLLYENWNLNVHMINIADRVYERVSEYVIIYWWIFPMGHKFHLSNIMRKILKDMRKYLRVIIICYALIFHNVSIACITSKHESNLENFYYTDLKTFFSYNFWLFD